VNRIISRTQNHTFDSSNSNNDRSIHLQKDASPTGDATCIITTITVADSSLFPLEILGTAAGIVTSGSYGSTGFFNRFIDILSLEPSGIVKISRRLFRCKNEFDCLAQQPERFADCLQRMDCST
jgi:hypothetical protein